MLSFVDFVFVDFKLDYLCLLAEFFAVAGNCDISAKLLAKPYQEKLLTFDGVKILMGHGHAWGVKYGYGAAISLLLIAVVLVFMIAIGIVSARMERREEDER